MVKKVLIVDPFSTGVLYADKFKKLGFECLALISSQNLPKRLTQQLKREDFNIVFENIHECCDYLATDNNDLLIVAGSEGGVELAEQLCVKFGLSMNDPELADARRDKFIMQEHLRLNEVRHIPSVLVSKDDDYEELVANLVKNKDGYIMKPLKSVGSDGVKFCVTKENLLDGLKNINWQQPNFYGEINSAFLVQPFITGDEYVVDMVVCNEQIYVASMCKYDKISVNGAPFVYQGLDVLDPQDSKYLYIIEYALKATVALGFRAGPVHMEIKVDNDSPVMIEVGARMHGGIAPQLFGSCYEPHLLDQSINSFVKNEQHLAQAKLVNSGRIIFLINQKQCNFSIPKSLQNLMALPSYKGHKFFVMEQEPVSPTIDFNTCPGIFWLANSDKNVILEDEATIRSLFN